MTKIVKTLPITQQELADFKKKKIEEWINADCEKIEQQIDELVKFIDKQIKSQDWVYMSNRQVYYIPSIVGLFPDVSNFNANSYKDDYYSFSNEDLKQNFKLNFSGFSGELPSSEEIDKCINNSLIRNGSYIRLNNINKAGLAYKGKIIKFMLVMFIAIKSGHFMQILVMMIFGLCLFVV